ncbi:sugar phosphate isomerase/epimerase family protein [Nocardioides bruguierae]|uniref:sugar phosphate isomerase/epimerase family protein n=1 Tax=Nocardioides bruguierae TaxID=2945102 RepID=UPI00201FD55F|nr:sugar phosphate isomerase/epimerase [Nocardioides bruguierae]MCL8026812.1 sugar phosphate isomerase/epimerase [Nocardioides bruguierae]
MSRLSLNQQTTKSWTLAEALDGCRRHGLESVGVWREPVAEVGLDEAARLVRESGLRVSSLCRGGFVTAAAGPERARALADNRAAIDEAAALGAASLVLVVGGLPADAPRDLVGARQRVADALGELAPYARERGVLLALEPLHPMFAADRAVLSTLGQALDLAEQHPAEAVGVVVDTYHVWWDPQVLEQVARAAGRIASFQLCDWLTPIPAEALMGRGMPGDGHIDFAPLVDAVLAAGYAGDVEVELFNREIWAADPDEVVATMVERWHALLSGR